jgi:pyridoxal phosphate enzyme (YggS family)
MIEEAYQRLLKDIEVLKVPLPCICVVSKGQPVEKLEQFYQLGVRDFGENRPLELKEKAEFFLQKGILDIRWHFIGHIQSRQIPHILAYSYLIHSVHSQSTLLKLEERAKALRKFCKILLQVNVSGESTKQGFTEEELLKLAQEPLALIHLSLEGLMTMAPEGASSDSLRKTFKKTGDLARNLQSYWPKCRELSMGMSQDFPEALLEGATLLRIGSRLFK